MSSSGGGGGGKKRARPSKSSNSAKSGSNKGQRTLSSFWGGQKGAGAGGGDTREVASEPPRAKVPVPSASAPPSLADASASPSQGRPRNPFALSNNAQSPSSLGGVRHSFAARASDPGRAGPSARLSLFEALARSRSDRRADEAQDQPDAEDDSQRLTLSQRLAAERGQNGAASSSSGQGRDTSLDFLHLYTDLLPEQIDVGPFPGGLGASNRDDASRGAGASSSSSSPAKRRGNHQSNSNVFGDLLRASGGASAGGAFGVPRHGSLRFGAKERAAKRKEQEDFNGNFMGMGAGASSSSRSPAPSSRAPREAFFAPPDKRSRSDVARQAIRQSMVEANNRGRDDPKGWGYLNEARQTAAFADHFTQSRQRSGSAYPKILASQTRVPDANKRGNRYPDLVVAQRRGDGVENYLLDLKTAKLTIGDEREDAKSFGQLQSFAQATYTTNKRGQQIPVNPELSAVSFSSSSKKVSDHDIGVLKASGIRRARSNSMKPNDFLSVADFASRREARLGRGASASSSAPSRGGGGRKGCRKY
ncbi:MAG: hypothetical protein ACI8WB_003513 [Phenylobacterium sp.]|jgi:hypothetical protein